MSNIENCVLEKLNYDSQGNLTPFETPVITQIGEFGTIILNLKPSNPSEIKIYPNAKNGLYNANVQEYRYVEGNPLVGQFTYDANASALVFNNAEVGNHIMANINAIGWTYMAGESVATKYDSRGQVFETLDLTLLKTVNADNHIDGVNNVVMTKKDREDIQYSFDYNNMPQSPKPTKVGASSCTYKIIHKTNDDELIIVQNTNKGQVKYILQKNVGASVEGRDYGINHELIRLVGAYQLQDSYVYYDVATPKVGAYTGALYVPSARNTIEQYWLNSSEYNDSKSFGSKGNANGVGCYKLAYNTSVEFDLEVGANCVANVMFFSTPTSSQNIEMYVNNVLVKTFNARNFIVGNGSGIGIVDFKVPIMSTTNNTYTVKIKNADTTGNFNLCGLNCYKLSDYKGQFITDYKCIGSSKSGWIENNGASDYAMFDSVNKKWLGSYHGGEISEFDNILWCSQKVQENDYLLSNVTFASITANEWRVQKSFSMYQQTDLASGNGKMISIFNFDTDGTIDMDFSYYDGKLYYSNFYTGLVCTHSNFNWLHYPIRKQFTTPTNDYYYFDTVEGKVSQVNSKDKMQLDIRFTRFNHKNNTRKTCVADNSAYRKFYYGVIYDSKTGTAINSLTFSKSLDFIVR